jgi:hypothetical protein
LKNNNKSMKYEILYENLTNWNKGF